MEQMKGSTMDAMAEGVDGAEVMLYGVATTYKESANCRLEANYAHESGVDMIPLMCEKDFRPRGWLGLMLGTRLWYPMFELDTDEGVFESRVVAIAKEIGDRARPPQAQAPASVPVEVEEVVPPSSSATMRAQPVQQREPAPAPAPAGGFQPGRGAAQWASTDSSLDRLPLPGAPTALAPAAPALEESFSPSLHHSTGGGGGASNTSVAEERSGMLQLVQQQQEEQLQSLRRELVTQQAPAQHSAGAFTDEQVSTLQSRLVSMHSARLLTDETLYMLEDLLADVAEVRCASSSAPLDVAQRVVAKLDKLIGVSEAMQRDESLARQIQRKFVEG